MLGANFLLAVMFAVCKHMTMMKLSTYISQTGVKQAVLAEQLGIKPPHMSLLVRGDRKPSRALAAKIELVTDGAVPVSIWDEQPLKKAS